MSAVSALLGASEGAASWQQLRDMEALIGGCLQFVRSDGAAAQQPSALKPDSLRFLQVVHSPQHIQQVLAMSNTDLRQYLTRCMHKLAITLVQGRAVSMPPPPQAPCSSVSAGSVGADCRGGGHTLPAASQPGLLCEAAAPPACGAVGQRCGGGGGGGGSCDSGSGGSSGGEVCPAPSARDLGPCYQLTSTLAALFEWDEERFMTLIAGSLEDGSELPQRAQPAFGLWLGRQLQLTREQAATFKALRDVVKLPHEQVARDIRAAASQQHAAAAPQSERAAQARGMHAYAAAAAQVYDASQAALEQQRAALGRFRMLARYTGLLTLNTLTPVQMAILVTCSWPAICRIEPVLDVIDELTASAQ